MTGKVSALFQSRRFWAAVGGVLVVAFQDAFGFDETTAQNVSLVVIGWIVGDSLNKTE